MRHILIPAFCLVTLLSMHSNVSRGDPPQAKRPPSRLSDLQKLQGKWRATNLALSGIPLDYRKDELVCVFLDGKVIIYRSGRQVAVCEYSFDLKQRSAIDFTGEQLPAEWGNGKGIYAVDGDKLRLGFDPVSGDRPKKFGASWLVTFEREPLVF